MKPHEHSPAAIAKYPAPRREMYFIAVDYAAACMRVHNKRAEFDKLNPQPKRKIKPEALAHQVERRSGLDRRAVN